MIFEHTDRITGLNNLLSNKISQSRELAEVGSKSIHEFKFSSEIFEEKRSREIWKSQKFEKKEDFGINEVVDKNT